MPLFLRLILVAGALLLMMYMLKRIRHAKLKIEHSIFWIVFSVVLVIIGIFPDICYAISRWIGFQSPINMVYLIIIFILIVKMFFMTIQISQLENKIDNLVQECAIDRKIDQEEE